MRCFWAVRKPIGRLGQRVITVQHTVLVGVTPPMLLWWFQHFDGTMTVRGQTVPMHQGWHPVDHVRMSITHKSAEGLSQVGSTLHVIEYQGGDGGVYFDKRARVEKLDEGGMTLA